MTERRRPSVLGSGWSSARKGFPCAFMTFLLLFPAVPPEQPLKTTSSEPTPAQFPISASPAQRLVRPDSRQFARRTMPVRGHPALTEPDDRIGHQSVHRRLRGRLPRLSRGETVFHRATFVLPFHWFPRNAHPLPVRGCPLLLPTWREALRRDQCEPGRRSTNTSRCGCCRPRL